MSETALLASETSQRPTAKEASVGVLQLTDVALLMVAVVERLREEVCETKRQETPVVAESCVPVSVMGKFWAAATWLELGEMALSVGQEVAAVQVVDVL